MKIKITGIITVFIAIIVITMFSGCTNEKISAAEDINMATSLINSGADRIENINFEEDGYSDAKIKLSSELVAIAAADGVASFTTSACDMSTGSESNKVVSLVISARRTTIIVIINASVSVVPGE